MKDFIFAAFLIWRTVLFFNAYLGSRIISFSPRFPYSELFLGTSGLPFWLWSFANFDGVHYLTIAEKGYSAQFTQVFFPFYPILISILHKLLPWISHLSLGLILSNLLFIFSLFMFFRLLKLDYKAGQIRWAIILMLLFPTSFYFGSLYTESLYLFLVLSSFYCARKKNFIIVGILGALASATRITGIFLLPALLWEWQNQRSEIKDQKFKIKNSILIFIKSPVLYLVPLGLLSYMVYLQFVFGDALYFWHAQGVFGAQRSSGEIILLPQVIWRYMKIFLTVKPFTESFIIPLLEFLSTFLAIFFLILAHRKKVRLSYLIFAWPCVILPTLTGTLSSMPRYVLSAFPLFIAMGLINNKFIKFIIAILFGIILLYLTVLFTAGHWIA